MGQIQAPQAQGIQNILSSSLNDSSNIKVSSDGKISKQSGISKLWTSLTASKGAIATKNLNTITSMDSLLRQSGFSRAQRNAVLTPLMSRDIQSGARPIKGSDIASLIAISKQSAAITTCMNNVNSSAQRLAGSPAATVLPPTAATISGLLASAPTVASLNQQSLIALAGQITNQLVGTFDANLTGAQKLANLDSALLELASPLFKDTLEDVTAFRFNNTELPIADKQAFADNMSSLFAMVRANVEDLKAMSYTDAPAPQLPPTQQQRTTHGTALQNFVTQEANCEGRSKHTYQSQANAQVSTANHETFLRGNNDFDKSYRNPASHLLLPFTQSAIESDAEFMEYMAGAMREEDPTLYTESFEITPSHINGFLKNHPRRNEFHAVAVDKLIEAINRNPESKAKLIEQFRAMSQPILNAIETSTSTHKPELRAIALSGLYLGANAGVSAANPDATGYIASSLFTATMGAITPREPTPNSIKLFNFLLGNN